MIDVSCLPFRDELIARSCKTDATASTRPAEASNDGSRSRGHSDFLRHFGSFGCRQICVRRTEPKPRTPEDVGHFVLETLATWRAEGLDAERLYKVATIAIHFDPYKLPGIICMPACCRPWGRWNPPARQGRVAPHGRTAPTGDVTCGSDWAPAGAGCPLPDDLDEDLKRTGLAPKEREELVVINGVGDHPDVGQ